MSGRRGGRTVGALVALAVMITSAGCVGIPRSGPIVTGRVLADAPRPPRPQIYAAPPTLGDGPVAIVRGFLRAAADSSRGFEVARSYLTPEVRTTWRPDEPVSVYRGDTAGAPIERLVETDAPLRQGLTTPYRTSAARGPLPGARATVRVAVPLVARIGAHGIYQEARSDEVQVTTFTLVAVSGEWRIADPPEGRMVSAVDFSSTFADVALYYPEPGGRWLVPDVRWFALPTAATSVVEAVLAGPSPWLAPAVTQGLPPGLELTANGVRSDAGALLVDLDHQALTADGAQRQQLYAQLSTTLIRARQALALPVDRVVITVEQAQFEIPPWTSPPPRAAEEADLDARPVVLDGQNRLARLEGLRTVPVDGIAAFGPDAERPAVTPDGAAFALLTRGGTTLVTATADHPPRVVLTATGLTAPSMDSLGWAWSAPVNAAGRIYAVHGDVKVELPVAWLKGITVLAMRVSREGSRVAVLVGRGPRADRVELLVSGLARDGDGTPRAVGPRRRLVTDLTAARDVDWLDAQRVVVLGVRPGQKDQSAYLVQVGGVTSILATLPTARSVTVAGTRYPIWVQGPEGAAVLSGGTLARVPGARWPALPG